MAIRKLAAGKQPLSFILVSNDFIFRMRGTRKKYKVGFHENSKGALVKVYEWDKDWIELTGKQVKAGNDGFYPLLLLKDFFEKIAAKA